MTARRLAVLLTMLVLVMGAANPGACARVAEEGIPAARGPAESAGGAVHTAGTVLSEAEAARLPGIVQQLTGFSPEEQKTLLEGACTVNDTIEVARTRSDQQIAAAVRAYGGPTQRQARMRALVKEMQGASVGSAAGKAAVAAVCESVG